MAGRSVCGGGSQETRRCVVAGRKRDSQATKRTKTIFACVCGAFGEDLTRERGLAKCSLDASETSDLTRERGQVLSIKLLSQQFDAHMSSTEHVTRERALDLRTPLDAPSFGKESRLLLSAS